MCSNAYLSLDQNLLESRVSLAPVALIAKTKAKSRVLITGNAISFHGCSRDEACHDESCKLLYEER
jgi:NAD dependent epimerase/dehydratase family enzyme